MTKSTKSTKSTNKVGEVDEVNEDSAVNEVDEVDEVDEIDQVIEVDDALIVHMYNNAHVRRYSRRRVSRVTRLTTWLWCMAASVWATSVFD